ncbi:transporter [Candidatus Pacearchaeota archaeon]|nr:transporter [Candidatus Pacearchaeota archaeon]
MNIIVISLIFIIVLALIGVVGDFFIKIAGKEKNINWFWFIIGLTIYASTAFGWLFVMRHVKLSTLGVFYGISTVLFLVFLSVLYFKESLNYYEGLGIIFAIISIILLGRFA